MSPDSILVVSVVQHHDVHFTGVFSVQIDPDTLTYEGITEYPYAGGIYSIRWDDATASLLVVDGPSPGISRVVRGHLGQTGIVVDDEVVDATWGPRHVCLWPGHDGIVFSGIDPVSKIGGVYWRRSGASDSLLFAPIGFEVLSGQFSFTADGSSLVVCLDLPDTRTAQLISVSPGTQDSGRVVVARTHYSIGVEANPVDPDIVAFMYAFRGDDTNPPEDAVEVVRLSTGESEKLNVRTHTAVCHFTRTESISWDPDGRDIALASGASDGEGQTYRSRLWVFRSVPIP